jgi:arylsulfatase A-like enzyme
MWGPGIRHGSIERADIIDLAPTTLHLLGVPIPDDVDGRVLVEVYEGEALPAEHTSREVAGGGPVDLSETEEAEVLDRLKDLGYLG